MNAEHFRAFLWLHWRLRINQLKKGGIANAIVLGILAVGAVLLSAVLFVVFLMIGLYGLSDQDQVKPAILMYVWDAIVVGFLMFWMIGLVADLQRSEAISLEKFLHLPVSLSGVFLLNYLASLVSLTLILCLPAMLGLVLGLIIGRGASMLWLVPLLAAFLLMVTAVTYQFQGWLASLMVNKRRRRTIIVVVTAVFILIFQLPNLINIMRPWDRPQQDELLSQLKKDQTELDRARQAGEITAAEHQRRSAELHQKSGEQMAERYRASRAQLESAAWIANLLLPPGWLPWGAMAAAEGKGHYAILAGLGMGLLGFASLRRAYRTTLRLYTGQFTSGKRAAVALASGGLRPPLAVAEPTAKPGVGLLEKQLPWLSEHAAAIALTGLRALIRAPEVKMLLLTPIIMVVVFGGVFLRSESSPPELVRPLIAAGAMAMVLMTLIQLLGNQFGFDRSGFRVFVLCPASRGDILLGKNLAVAPLALVLGLVAVTLVLIVYPLRLDHLLAIVPQMITMYLLFCLLANCLSIIAPMPIAAGTLKPTNTKGLVILLHFAFLFVFPIPVALTMAPLGVEAIVEGLSKVEGLPINLVLSLAECAGVVCFYRWLVGWQGVWLHAREQRILEIVAAKAE